ncbi:uncharacterized protein G2W53_018257 [Senna tora]|uniref:Uncharacterized protein n=1 Tax=Senna tora TaxID=362788 RepID=A0A834TRP5_9FABA|nr:uncharacterized protein G2W53_018257 [Senna tora]
MGQKKSKAKDGNQEGMLGLQ